MTNPTTPDFEAKARELSDSWKYRPVEPVEPYIQDIAQALKQAYADGRRAGLEEARKVASVISVMVGEMIGGGHEPNGAEDCEGALKAMIGGVSKEGALHKILLDYAYSEEEIRELIEGDEK